MGIDSSNHNINKDIELTDYKTDFFKYCIFSKKCGEKTLDDSFLSQPNISVVNDSKETNFSLFGVFDGHNSDYVSHYLSKNFQKLYEKEVGNINKDNYQSKIEEIFKAMDKQLKGEQKENIQEANKEEENNIMNINNDNNIENSIKSLDLSVKDNEFNLIKESIQNGQDIPEDLKDIDDSDIKDLLLFKNLFQYNNNYLYNNNNLNYIGSSASVVLINDNNIITADLGLTKCILFNKDGIILNNKETKIYEEHTFKNKEEKKRIKKFNKSIDYESLKINFYVPASRSFGFFEYKENEVLNEENQIISCVPDVYIYDRNMIDFILLVSRGMFPTNDSLKKLLDKIKKAKKVNNENDIEIELADIIKEYFKYKKDEIKRISSKKNQKIPKGNTMNTKDEHKSISSIYIGKEDGAEEKEIIKQLDEKYFTDVMNINKTYDCNRDYNSTCILIQLLKNQTQENKKNENDIKNEENAKKVSEEKEKEKEKEKEIKILEDNKDELENNKNEENKIENENKEKEKNENKNEIKNENGEKIGEINNKKEEDNKNKSEKDNIN